MSTNRMTVQPQSAVRRRQFLLAAGAGLAAAGCAPAAAPPPPAVSPSPAPAASAPGAGAWEKDWESLVPAAKAEGAFSIITISGTTYRQWLSAFEEAFPGIKVELNQVPQVQAYVSRLLEERKAGVYGVDLLLTGVLVLPGLKAAGALDPLRPRLIRPDVIDDKNWRDGFNGGWQDNDKQLGYNGAEDVLSAHINTDLVKDGEIKSVQDLLDPKWKGKIMWIDPRTSGFTAGPMTAIRLKYGEDTVKRLLVDQQPAFSRDNRQITEGLLRGTYALATGVTQPVLDQFVQQGLGKNVKFVDIVDFATTGSGDGLWVMNRAPHPNATKLFVNWALTKAGQESYSKTVAGNSRRADVAAATPERLPRQGQTYFRNLESTVPEVVKTREYIAMLLGSA